MPLESPCYGPVSLLLAILDVGLLCIMEASLLRSSCPGYAVSFIQFSDQQFVTGVSIHSILPLNVPLYWRTREKLVFRQIHLKSGIMHTTCTMHRSTTCKSHSLRNTQNRVETIIRLEIHF